MCRRVLVKLAGWCNHVHQGTRAFVQIFVTEAPVSPSVLSCTLLIHSASPTKTDLQVEAFGDGTSNTKGVSHGVSGHRDKLTVSGFKKSRSQNRNGVVFGTLLIHPRSKMNMSFMLHLSQNSKREKMISQATHTHLLFLPPCLPLSSHLRTTH